MSVDIGLCRANEVEDLVRFLREHWSATHVFTQSRALLDWQHRRPDGDYNFLVARRPGETDLLGVLGFIPTDRYDPALRREAATWLALWKVRPDAGVAGLGVALLSELAELSGGGTLGVVGIGDARHHRMYQALGYVSGQMRQYVLPNPSIQSHEIAVFPEAFLKLRPKAGRAQIRRLDASALAAAFGGDDAWNRNLHIIPRKTARYFATRFLAHPFYQYDVFAVECDGGDAGLLATRAATWNGARVVRIVDYAGPEHAFAELGSALHALLEREHAEYADVWNAGMREETFTAAGFSPVDPDGEMVVPNYFEPFARRNGRIGYAIRVPPSVEARAMIFRADGDQDRPNEISAATAA